MPQKDGLKQAGKSQTQKRGGKKPGYFLMAGSRSWIKAQKSWKIRIAIQVSILTEPVKAKKVTKAKPTIMDRIISALTIAVLLLQRRAAATARI